MGFSPRNHGLQHLHCVEFAGLADLQGRSRAGGAAILTAAALHQFHAGAGHLLVNLEKFCTVADAAGIALPDENRGLVPEGGAHHGQDRDIARIAHNEKRGDMTEHIGGGLEAVTELLLGDAQFFMNGLRKGIPESRGVHGRFGQIDLAPADIFMGAEFDLFVHRRHAGDRNLAIAGHLAADGFLLDDIQHPQIAF